jgi:hypothetical protein
MIKKVHISDSSHAASSGEFKSKNNKNKENKGSQG